MDAQLMGFMSNEGLVDFSSNFSIPSTSCCLETFFFFFSEETDVQANANVGPKHPKKTVMMRVCSPLTTPCCYLLP